MKLLTAGCAELGKRENDFSWTIEGELVWFGPVCRRDADDPDGPCGCGRAFSGLSSHRATTIAMVRDLPLDVHDVCVALAGYVESAGYGSPTPYEVLDEVTEVLSFIADLPDGTVLGRRLEAIEIRTPSR